MYNSIKVNSNTVIAQNHAKIENVNNKYTLIENSDKNQPKDYTGVYLLLSELPYQLGTEELI